MFRQADHTGDAPDAGIGVMRCGLWLVLLLWSAGAVCGQPAETLLGDDLTYGVFAAPVVRWTVFDGDAAMLAGGRVGWILHVHPRHALVLGGGGYGLVTRHRVAGVTRNGRPMYLTFGYGGLELEYVHRPRRLLHPTVQVLVGAGGVGYREALVDGGRTGALEPFFVVEPGVRVVLNVTPHLRLGLGGGYRFVRGVRLPPLGAADLSRAAGVVSVRVGRF
ncbi:MAG: hypothetical protein D6685_15440 [Bacteroidetes bacterium]|nr:MAG: hypothetical protein D6685_15440 [Bacteroidota bacterium]